MTPKLVASSLDANREWRRQQLIEATMQLVLELGVENVTITAIAKKAGISRSAIYEYFASSSDIIADLVVEEMELYGQALASAIDPSLPAIDQIELWIQAALNYVADGRHKFIKSLSSLSMPDYRKSEIAQGHTLIMKTILPPLQQMGISNPRVALQYLQVTVDTAANRIDQGNDAERETQQAIAFALAGLQALHNLDLSH